MTDALGMVLRAGAEKRSHKSPRGEISSFLLTFSHFPGTVEFQIAFSEIRETIILHFPKFNIFITFLHIR